MPQLDIKTFYMINITFFVSFWIIFSIIYIAVSYTLSKLSASYELSLYIVLVSLFLVYSVTEPTENIDENNVLSATSTSESLVSDIK